MRGLNINRDLAVDPGTANTRVFVRGRGVVLDEPSVVALQREGGQIVAVGADARAMVGRTPGSIITTRPLKDGSIANYKVAEGMLRAFISKALASGGFGRGFGRTRIAVCIPSQLDDMGQRSFHESARAAGAKEVVLLPAILAAALGSGLQVLAPRGTMVVDIGGGLTEVGVFSLGGVVQAHAIKVGGVAMDRAITRHVAERHGLLIGEHTAEVAKREAARAVQKGRDHTATLRGRDAQTGIPRQVELTSAQLHVAISPLLDQIVEAVRHTLSNTPPEVAGDILDNGVVLCGGGARLRGMERLLRKRTGLPVVVAEDPEHCAARGAGAALEHPELLERIALT